MRSLVSLLGLALAACGTDEAPPVDPACVESPLTYRSFGEPFLLDWCRGCHSSGLSEANRQGAPLGIDFDDVDRVREHLPRIAVRATGAAPTMPASGGPSDEERALLAEWISCGAPQ
jgi:hypothetical protein